MPKHQSGWVNDGGLMSSAADELDNQRRGAIFVDNILKGRKPSDLSVEQPMKFEFVVNLNAAKQFGFTVPPNVLVRADRVIRCGKSKKAKGKISEHRSRSAGPLFD